MSTSPEREIRFKIRLDENNVAESIRWWATDAPGGEQDCDAFLLSLWDAENQATLRIDLWTKTMQVDHMNAFFSQTFMTLADTFQRATGNEEAADGIRRFAEDLARQVALPPDPSSPGS